MASPEEDAWAMPPNATDQETLGRLFRQYRAINACNYIPPEIQGVFPTEPLPNFNPDIVYEFVPIETEEMEQERLAAEKAELINQTIRQLEAQKKGEIVKEQKGMSRAMKRNNKDVHHSGVNCLCSWCLNHGTFKAGPSVEKADEPLTKYLVEACKKKGTLVSTGYAQAFLLRNDKKIVAAMKAILEALETREAAMVNTGRIKFAREAEMAIKSGCTSRDEIVTFIENDDYHIRQFMEHRWNSKYGQEVKKRNPTLMNKWEELYVREEEYRVARATYYAELMAEIEAGTTDQDGLVKAMAAYDDAGDKAAEKTAEEDKAHRAKKEAAAQNGAAGPSKRSVVEEEVGEEEGDEGEDGLDDSQGAERGNASQVDPETSDVYESDEYIDAAEFEISSNIGTETLVEDKDPEEEAEAAEAVESIPTDKKSKKRNRKKKSNSAAAKTSKVYYYSNGQPMSKLDNAVQAILEQNKKDREKMTATQKALEEKEMQKEIEIRKARGEFDYLSQYMAKEWIKERGEEEIVQKLKNCDPAERMRHRHLLKVHDDITGSIFLDCPKDEEAIDHMIEMCPWMKGPRARERAHGELTIAYGHASLAVEFSQVREKELNKLLGEDREPLSEDEAFRFITAVVHKITPGGN